MDVYHLMLAVLGLMSLAQSLVLQTSPKGKIFLWLYHYLEITEYFIILHFRKHYHHGYIPFDACCAWVDEFGPEFGLVVSVR